MLAFSIFSADTMRGATSVRASLSLRRFPRYAALCCGFSRCFLARKRASPARSAGNNATGPAAAGERRNSKYLRSVKEIFGWDSEK
jgi:hypothetical protein